MKIHLSPPLPPTPPSPPPKAPPTPFELEQRTQELLAASKQQRAHREQLSRVSRRRQRPHEDAGSDDNEADQRPSRKTIDFLA
jgi:hypothetical protein